jgi:hypothetical protein
MIRSAWRYREIQKGHPTGRYSRRHIARFLIWAIYSTRRKGALLNTALGPAVGCPWVDLDRGILYGRPQPKENRACKSNRLSPQRRVRSRASFDPSVGLALRHPYEGFFTAISSEARRAIVNGGCFKASSSQSVTIETS